jgi:hypothetical protein
MTHRRSIHYSTSSCSPSHSSTQYSLITVSFTPRVQWSLYFKIALIKGIDLLEEVASVVADMRLPLSCKSWALVGMLFVTNLGVGQHVTARNAAGFRVAQKWSFLNKSCSQLHRGRCYEHNFRRHLPIFGEKYWRFS